MKIRDAQTPPCALLEDHLDGLLDPEQEKLFVAHLDECPECRETIEDEELVGKALMRCFDEPMSDVAELRIRRDLGSRSDAGDTAPEILDLEGAAGLLDISVAEVAEMLDRLPWFEVSGKLRFGRDSLMRWAGEQEQKQRQERSSRELSTSRKILVFPGGK